MAKSDLTFKRALSAVLIFLIILAAFFAVYRFHHVLFILFVAVVLGTVTRPAHEKLQQWGLSKNLATTLILLFFSILIVGFVLLLLPLLTSQYQTLLSAIPKYYETILSWFSNSRNELIVRLSESLPAELILSEQAAQADQDAIETINGAARFLNSGLNSFLVMAVLLLLSYHWMVSGRQILSTLLFFIKAEKRQNILEIIQQIENKVSQYLVGQGVLCLSIGSLSLIAYLLLGLPNAFLLALIAGIFEAVPMVGPVLGAIPAVMIALSISPSTLIWVLVSAVIIQQIENNLLVPRVMDKVVGVNPFISILAITTFSGLYGVGGALMAIPLAAVIQLILEKTVMDKEKENEALSSSRDKLNLLRYETQDFLAGMQNQSRQSKHEKVEPSGKIDLVMEEMEMVARDLDALLAQKAEEQS